MNRCFVSQRKKRFPGAGSSGRKVKRQHGEFVEGKEAPDGEAQSSRGYWGS